MSHTDPIADMLTRMRNAIMARKEEVSLPLSGMKLQIINVLKREGYIHGYKVDKSQAPHQIIINLKYNNKKKSIIDGVKRVSKPGRRVYAGVDNIPRVLGGLGISVLSTSRGIMTGKECAKNNIGGEVLLYVW